MDIITLVWIIGFLASIVFLIASIVDYYRKGKKSKRPIIISGIACFVLSVPIILFVVLIIGLSTGLVGM